MAREWACSEEGYDGYANEYRFDGRGLKVLELSSPEYSTLHWLALLLEHRKIDLRTPVAQAGSEFLRAHYLLDAESFDVIVGHRADDSYFTFARAFLRNDVSLEQLTRALHLGDLGQQIVLKSPEAFKAIEFVETTVRPAPFTTLSGRSATRRRGRSIARRLPGRASTVFSCATFCEKR